MKSQPIEKGQRAEKEKLRYIQTTLVYTEWFTETDSPDFSVKGQ